MKRYDVIIVGAGPAGIFSALELVKGNTGVKVLLIEKGQDIDKRQSPSDILSGWGGAGAFSDGKLNLSTEVGGFLTRYLDTKTLQNLIEYVDAIYVGFGAPEELHGNNPAEIEKLKRLASEKNLTLIPSQIRHIGTDKCLSLLKKMKEFLNSQVDIVFEAAAENILIEGGKTKGILLKNGEEILSDFIIVAPGREGSGWLEEKAKTFNLTLLQNPVDIGVRVEIPATVFEPLTGSTYEPKLIFYSKKFDDKVRTFCVNPYGEVVKEHIKDIWTVNGHSYAHKKTPNTNFALLVSTTFTEPFKDPISYGSYIARLANLLGQGVMVQRLGDLQAGKRSTHARITKNLVQPTLKDATPGDLSFVLPYRYLSDILEMLETLDRIAPGVNSEHTLLYGVEVKFYSMQIKLTNSLETEIENLFAIGDGAGVSRGLVQASVSGIIAAREILKRINERETI